MLTSYEQFYIQTDHPEVKPIPEQYPDEQNPLFQKPIHPTQNMKGSVVL